MAHDEAHESDDHKSQAVLTVYFLFHSDSEHAADLAADAMRWLRLRQHDADGSGIGLPVYFRTKPHVDESTAGKTDDERREPPAEADIEPPAEADIETLANWALSRVEPPIALDASHLVLVPIVDDAMVMDEAWRGALRALARLAATRRHALATDAERAELKAEEARQRREGEPISRARRLDLDAPLVAVPSASEVEATRFLSILPVMADRSFTALGAFSELHNPIRIWHPADQPPGRKPAEEADAEAKRAWRERNAAWSRKRALRLRRALTETMVRDLDEASWLRRRARQPAARPGRLKVFISHAKADGDAIAQLIRDGLASVSKLEPWFDQNDLQAGKVWAAPMEAAAGGSSGGMIAVVTDAYPSRPWCWREASAARTPVTLWTGDPDDVDGGSPARPRVFSVLPAVAVHVAERSWTRTPPSLANVPRIGWPPKPPRPEKGETGVELAGHRSLEQWQDLMKARVADIVDRLLLELLMHRVFHLRVRSLSRPAPSATAFIDCPPDARILGHVQKELGRLEPATPPKELIYPGHGLRSAEREELTENARGIVPGLSVISIEQLQLRRARERREAEERLFPPPAARPLIGLSAGGSDTDLLDRGLSLGHVDDFTVRLTRLLLQNGFRIAYGGALQLANTRHNLTQAVLDAARGWKDGSPGEWGYRGAAEAEGSEPDLAVDPLEYPPVVNYAAHDYYRDITTAVEGEHAGIARFVPIDSGDGVEAHRTPDSLTKMRKRMAGDCDGRIVCGGRVHGASGWLPGIAEEVLASARHNQADPGAIRPVLVLTGLGGCAELVGDVLEGPKPEQSLAELSWVKELEWREAHDPAARVRPDRRKTKARFQRMQRDLMALRAKRDEAGIEVCREEDATKMLARVLNWLDDRFPRASPSSTGR